eukprot:SAG31_NODE_28340_length_411_cov_1.157051_2_plen_44_part_01
MVIRANNSDPNRNSDPNGNLSEWSDLALDNPSTWNALKAAVACA